ncbi:4-hydroxy-tetrahydrodipicolinate reductase [Helicobacter vulpis]|uniref:4-hydroxy-tetrahydrodipicolinate reductase n=1 Tax=Helicobacter vulpis TaxID=2316076 RepID=UPI000EAD5FDB|nr:4-hydroxy-tetrahydrodipicolinate reductase [Helicobacter vulpis]
MLNIGIFGASGRMGRLLVQETKKHPDLCLSSVFVRRSLSPSLIQILPENTFVTNDLEQFLTHCALVIDFSLPQALASLLTALRKHPLPLVCGTTGLSAPVWGDLQELSQHAPVLHSSNMSLGMAVLLKIVSVIAKDLKHADIEIVETHHRYKKDAPSGTALTLGQACALARGWDFEKVRTTHRDTPRQEKEIGLASLRGGNVVGKHTVGFYLDGEYLEVEHVVSERDIFAKGALQVAKWLVLQPPGFYGVENLYH